MRIKHLLFAILTAGILAGTGCKEDETTLPGDNNNNPGGDPALAEVGNVPTTFTKKVVIEKYTGEWCVNCPDGAAKLKAVLDAHPGVTYAAEIHQGDWLELPQLNTLKTHLGGIGGYPRASIDRVPAQGTQGQDGYIVYSRGFWETNTARLLQQNKSNAGLAISSKLNGDMLDIKVFAASNTPISKDTRLTVYILEGDIVAKKQIGGTPGYTHHHVLRKVVSAGLGDPIDLSVAGKYVMKEYKGIDLSGFDKGGFSVLAFVNVVGASSNQHEILNAQEADAGTVAKWD